MTVINASNWVKYEAGDELIFGIGEKDSLTPFVHVAVNKKSEHITAIRDHFGQEPFYYSYQNRRFVFGSTIPDIIKHLPSHPKPNMARIARDLLPWTGIDWPPYSNETYYEQIFRVEPGHTLTIRGNDVQSKPYWQLDPDAPRLIYKNDHDYVDHFAELLHEAVKACFSNVNSVAAEFSGGIDSSSIISACYHLGLEPALYSHVAPENSEEDDDYVSAKCVAEHLQLKPIKRVTADNFDLVDVLQKMSSLYCGAPPYAFYMLANNVHQTVRDDGHTVLLSGYGGDECVSGHGNLSTYYSQLLAEGQYRHLWKYVKTRYRPRIRRRQRMPHYSNWQQMEWDLLQGPRSHQVRLRIEYSAVAAKALGFSYAYPLLYPKLVEFYHQLPLNQKRRDGVTRYLIRQYLSRYIPQSVWAKKKVGGGIVPATLHATKQLYKSGALDEHFCDLPFGDQLREPQNPTSELLAKIDAYMFKHYWSGVRLP